MTLYELEVAASVGEWTLIKTGDDVKPNHDRLFVDCWCGETQIDLVGLGIVNDQKVIIGYIETFGEDGNHEIPFCYKKV